MSSVMHPLEKSRRQMSLGNRQFAKGAYWFTAGFLSAFLEFGSLAVRAEEGMAAHYSDAFQGKRAAGGGTFDQEGLTAATHEKYAFGTKVKVTNLKTKKSVVVTVTDRLAAGNRTIIDISRRAAQEIGMERSGRARVRVDVQP
jgi:rare lipoprotein A